MRIENDIHRSSTNNDILYFQQNGNSYVRGAVKIKLTSGFSKSEDLKPPNSHPLLSQSYRVSGQSYRAVRVVEFGWAEACNENAR